MYLTEAKALAKNLIDALTALCDASTGISDADFDALAKQKAAYENGIVKAKQQLDEVSRATNEAADKVRESAAKEKAALEQQIAALNQSLNTLKAEATAAREKMLSDLQTEKAGLLSAKAEQIRKLDETIAVRQKLLADINASIESERKRFA